MTATVEPRTGRSWITVEVSGLKAGAECEMVVTDKDDRGWIAGSWAVSEEAARAGCHFAGRVLVRTDQVESVVVRSRDGQKLISSTI